MRSALLERIAEISPGLTYLIDVQTNRYVFVSRGIERALGYPLSEFMEKGPDFTISLMHPADRERVMRHHMEQLQRLSQEPPEVQAAYVHIDEYRLRHAKGHWIWIRGSAVIFEKNDDGSVRSILGAAQDITEFKQMEARIRLSDRMASVGRLAAGVAHEINNPLAHLMASLELLTEEAGAGEGLRAKLEEIHQSAGRIARLVGDLKAFSRADAESLEPVDVPRCLEATIPIVANEIRHRAQLRLELGKVPRVLANEGRLGQVFINLLANAAQAIPEGDRARNSIRVSAAHEASGKVAIEIADTGVGIDPESMKVLFDPFFTTKPIGQGTGLGLAICNDIVRSFGGEIEVRSEPGKGATFRVLLSAADGESVPASPQERAHVPALPARRGRMLIVDDEMSVGNVIAQALSTEHEVVLTQSSAECLGILLSDKVGFDAIFCDLMMPQMTGVDLFERVRDLLPGLEFRFVFLTGGAFTPRTQEFLRHVKNPVVHKPFRIPQIREMARKMIRQPG